MRDDVTLYVTHLVLVMHFKRLISDIIQLQSVSTAAAALPAVTGEAVTGYPVIVWTSPAAMARSVVDWICPAAEAYSLNL